MTGGQAVGIDLLTRWDMPWNRPATDGNCRAFLRAKVALLLHLSAINRR